MLLDFGRIGLQIIYEHKILGLKKYRNSFKEIKFIPNIINNRIIQITVKKLGDSGKIHPFYIKIKYC